MLNTEEGKHKRARARRGSLPAPGGGTAADGNAAKPDTPAAAQKNPARSGHFTPEEATTRFHADMLDELYCRYWILRKMHGDNPACPYCGLRLEGATLKSFWAGKRCHCGRCGRWFTARTGTFLSAAELTYSQVFLLAALIPTGLTPARIAAFVGVSADTVRIWSKRFKSFEY